MTELDELPPPTPPLPLPGDEKLSLPFTTEGEGNSGRGNGCGTADIDQCFKLGGERDPEFGETGNDFDPSLTGRKPRSNSVTCRSFRCLVSRLLDSNDRSLLRGESEGEEEDEDPREKNTFLNEGIKQQYSTVNTTPPNKTINPPPNLTKTPKLAKLYII